MSEVLHRYLEGLQRSDRHFRKFWRHRTPREQSRYRDTWQICDLLSNLPTEELLARQEVAHVETRRWFSLVQEIGFSYSRLPKDWTLVVENRSRQYRLYRYNRDNLQRFIQSLELKDSALLYGGVKPLESIRQKAFIHKGGTAVQRNVLDIWDLVRFRICTYSMLDLLRVGVAIWDRYFASVLRCRNYYFYPRGGNTQDAYRAIHFELLDERGGMFEIQIMSAFREAVSLLDHAPRFKRVVDFLDSAHELWLTRMGMAANIAEFEREEIAPFSAILGRRADKQEVI